METEPASPPRTPFAWPWRAPQARISLAEDPLDSGVAPGAKVGEEALKPRLPFTRCSYADPGAGIWSQDQPSWEGDCKVKAT